VRQYQKIGEFWLPCRDETFVDVKLYGKKVLTIDHREYTINGEAGDEQAHGLFVTAKLRFVEKLMPSVE